MWNRVLILMVSTLILGALTFVLLDYTHILFLFWIAGALACAIYGARIFRMARSAGITLIVFVILQLVAFFIVPQFLRL